MRRMQSLPSLPRHATVDRTPSVSLPPAPLPPQHPSLPNAPTPSPRGPARPLANDAASSTTSPRGPARSLSNDAASSTTSPRGRRTSNSAPMPPAAPVRPPSASLLVDVPAEELLAWPPEAAAAAAATASAATVAHSEDDLDLDDRLMSPPPPRRTAPPPLRWRTEPLPTIAEGRLLRTGGGGGGDAVSIPGGVAVAQHSTDSADALAASPPASAAARPPPPPPLVHVDSNASVTSYASDYPASADYQSTLLASTSVVMAVEAFSSRRSKYARWCRAIRVAAQTLPSSSLSDVPPPPPQRRAQPVAKDLPAVGEDGCLAPHLRAVSRGRGGRRRRTCGR